MASGNFLIGKDLSLKGFDKYVEPLFKKKGYSVQDRLNVSHDQDKAILISVSGEGDLEKGISDALVKSGEIMDAEMKELGFDKMISYNHQVSQFSHWEGKVGTGKKIVLGIYKTIGVYKEDDAASKLFPSIAQKYLLDGLEDRIEEVAQKAKNLREIFNK